MFEFFPIDLYGKCEIGEGSGGYEGSYNLQGSCPIFLFCALLQDDLNGVGCMSLFQAVVAGLTFLCFSMT